ncbi:DUF4232 domain-containing protein [Amycolatopsis acidiphila]|uniref:DUF4232 domain-containing protein n=1 Tax=Amycolatopsis acidiphila TaxID=715473 RepID=A0A558AFE8_9PSEU|nr:DUF4232 domain-containing protein [Amycolatopsis acidiphila]TVT22995.1 DUF4232 domain-containing protein [Amycolatopsis acidiphila]UIJ57162.1 DUF4232 domain-containing protein [Amycolatopsis acidiphila]GHG52971.1 hypothetical protein GCM10017788_01350 [Amycolatopsis acidiphila]
MRCAVVLLLLLALTACGRVGQYDNGIDPRLLTAGPVASPSPVPASPTPAACPAPGLSVEAGEVEAALGHRASVLTVTNCGTHPIRLEGYPEIRLLDGGGVPMPVTLLHDSSYMARDPGPSPVTVEPGGRALSVLSWSGTVTYGDRSTGSSVEVVPIPGAATQTLPLDADLGTTAQVHVTAWARNLLN